MSESYTESSDTGDSGGGREMNFTDAEKVERLQECLQDILQGLYECKSDVDYENVKHVIQTYCPWLW